MNILNLLKKINLKLDYKFYITNQITKPVGQIYSLIVEKLDGFKYKEDHCTTEHKSLLNTLTETKAKNKTTEIHILQMRDIIFSDVIRVATIEKINQELLISLK